MNDLEQILDCLRWLQNRGWPIRFFRVHGDDWIGLPEYWPNKMFSTTPDESRFNPVHEDILRGFVEREIERRGLWKRYLEAITTRSAPSQNGKGVLWWRDTEHRPTLLEVLKAAVGVTEEK